MADVKVPCSQRAATIQIPVYLGDSIQWREQNVDLWSAGNLVIHTDDQRDLFGSELAFPDALLDDASKFDQLVNELADRSAKRKLHSAVPSLKAVFSRLAIRPQHQAVIELTFKTMCRLHDEGRDHIWGYYVRTGLLGQEQHTMGQRGCRGPV